MTLLPVTRGRLGTTKSNRALHALPATALAMDLALILLVGGLAAISRERLGIFDHSSEVVSTLGLAGPTILFAWVLAIALAGGYRSDLFGAGMDEYKRVVNASLVTAAAVGIGCYLAKFQLSRGFFVLAFVIGIPALIVGRFCLRRALHSARRRGALKQRTLIVGSSVHVDEVAAVLRREPWLGYDVVGALTPEYDLEETQTGVPVLGNSDEAVELAKKEGIEVIFFGAGAVASANQMQKVVWDLEHEAVQVVVAPSLADISNDRVRIRPVGGLPLMHIDPPRATDASQWGKRLFDIAGSLSLILLFAPLLAFTAARIKAFDGGPVLFRQTRIGRNGEEFQCLKFRTMVVDAESLIADLQREHGASALLFKMKDDPRITKPGTWLRRYSIDEIPQLFNVFRGDMSLVGPRPQVAREVALYSGGMIRRLRVRPGMTGLWQVSGRNDLSLEEAIRLDLFYVDNWSMLQDISILARTFGAVLQSRGAY